MPGTSEYATLDATEHMVADKAAEEVEVMTCGGREDSTPSNLAEEVPEIRDESGIVERVRILFSFASPVIVSFFLSFCGNFINLIFCGHFVPSKAGPTAAQVFAGVSLANMYANVTFLSIIVGLSGSVETLGSQQNGAKNYKEVGLVLQRSVFLLLIVCLPCYLTWKYATPLFILMKVEPMVCKVIGDYLAIRAFEMPMSTITVSMEKYLSSIQVYSPSLYAETHFNISLISLNLLFIYGGFDFGYLGLGYAWVLSKAAALCTVIAMAWHEPAVQRTMQPINFQEILVYKKLYEFISLGIPGMLMLLSEWWAYEILSIFAGLLGTVQVAAQTIILSTAALAYMVPLGLGIATASLVGNSIGAGKKNLAIEIAHLSIQCITALEFFIGVLIFFFGEYFVRLFTDDKVVLAEAKSIMGFLAIFVLIDGLNAVCGGVLRGTGKQNLGAVTNIIAYYFVGLPCAWALTFTYGWGVVGLMCGLSTGTFLQSVTMVSLITLFPGYVFTSALVPNSGECSNNSSTGPSSLPGKSFVIEGTNDDDDDV
jgi:MATE family multidrug resistance protein